jgi:hypothetical protein
VAELVQNQYRFDVGLILGSSSAITAADRIKGYESTDEMLAASFTETMPEYLAAMKYFAQTPSPKKVMIGRIDTEETPVQALTACKAKSSDFYPVYACGAAEAAIAALSAYIKTTGGMVLVYENSAVIDTASGEEGVFATLKATNTDRALGVWNGTTYAGAALMGLACGLANKYRDKAWQLCYKQLQGIDPSSIEQPQVTALKGVNANVYVARGPKNLVEVGAVASGKRYDEVVSIDRIASDLQQASFDLITGSETKLPQDDSTTVKFFSAFSAALKKHVDSSVLGQGIWRGEKFRTLETGTALPDGFLLMADSYSRQSNEDRLAKMAVPMYAVVHLSGAVESAVIELAAQL